MSFDHLGAMFRHRGELRNLTVARTPRTPYIILATLPLCP